MPDPDKENFLGQGWGFPPEFIPYAGGTGTVRLAANEEDVEESLRILLSTQPGERVMHPRYGCDLSPMLFEPITQTLATLMAERIRTAILYFEPRVAPEKVTVREMNPGEGVITIEVNYRIRATNSRRNLVFPFYREEGRAP